jgi:hypothetical protein
MLDRDDEVNMTAVMQLLMMTVTELLPTIAVTLVLYCLPPAQRRRSWTIVSAGAACHALGATSSTVLLTPRCLS